LRKASKKIVISATRLRKFRAEWPEMLGNKRKCPIDPHALLRKKYPTGIFLKIIKQLTER
jgi:hypothetical protein